MKHLVLKVFLPFLFIVFSTYTASAKTALSSPATQLEVEFKTNEVHGLYNFVQGIAGGPGGTSPTLTELFENSDYNNDKNQVLIERYRKINVSYDYAFSEEVAHRHNKRQVTQLLVMASTQASDIDDFAQRIMGLLTNSDLMVLVETLNAFSPIYKELIWDKSQSQLKRNIRVLTDRAKQVDFGGRFAKASKFYNANWKAEIPFKVYLAPIPQKGGFTTATPQGNIISYIISDFDDADGVLAVVFHELAHLLYSSQSIELQAQLEESFLKHDSYHKAHSYQLLNEALATAIGNGWFYKETNGSLDKKEWYHSKYINQQAKAIYPLVEKYLLSGKSIDADFVDDYIDQYAKNFPKGYLQPESFLANVSFLADKDFHEHNKLFQLFFEHQRTVRSLNVQTPFFNQEAMSKFNGAINAKMILITDKHKENFTKFIEYYPGLEKAKLPDGEFVLHSLIPDGTMLLIVSINNLDSFGKAMKALTDKEVLDEYIRVIEL